MALTIRRGDTVEYYVIFKDANGAVRDLTGFTLYLTLKTSLALADDAGLPNVMQVTGSSGTPATGEAKFTLPSDETKLLSENTQYFYDAQAHDASVPPVVYTQEFDVVTIGAEVTLTDA